MRPLKPTLVVFKTYECTIYECTIYECTIYDKMTFRTAEKYHFAKVTGTGTCPAGFHYTLVRL